MSKILQKPSINAITPFDPKYGCTVSFVYDDNQAVGNRAVITDNDTGVTVYEVEQTTWRLEHVIGVDNKLKPGHKYLIQIQVCDADDNWSELSDHVLFYCFTTPEFTFKNIANGDTYRNASITLDLKYTQNEGEPIRNFQFMQYSYDKTLISSSSLYYSSNPMTYTFKSLENNTTYYFRAIGETSHGMPLDTGDIEVNISYDKIPMDVVLNVENNYCYGYIALDLNIGVPGYELESDVGFSYGDGTISLADNSLTYNNISASNDLSLYVDAKKVKLGTFFTANDNSFSLSVINVCGVYYCELSVADSDFKQYIELTDVKKENNGLITLFSEQDNATAIFEVKRINGLYDLKVYNSLD